MRYTLSAVLCVFFLSSMGQTSISITEPYGDDFIASELIDEVDVVPLQLEKYGMISTDMEMKVDGTNYFILDNKFTQKVYRFSADGVLLNTIGGQKKEENESDFPLLNNPVKFSINPFQQQVEIYNFENSSIDRFRYDGSFVDRVVFKVNLSDFVCNTNDGYWLYLGWNNSDTQYRLVKTDRKGKIIDHKMRLISKCTPIEGFSFSRYDQKICFWELLGNTVYHIEKGEIKPQYTFNFGTYSLPLDYHILAGDDSYMMINQKGYYTIKKYIENDDFTYFFLTYNSIEQREMFHVIHDKNSGQVFVYTENPAIAVFNKAQGITADDELLFLVTPRKMRQLLGSGTSFVPAPFEGILDDVKRMRNPILLKLKLKSIDSNGEMKEKGSNDSLYFNN